jgi:hypothetical protein
LRTLRALQQIGDGGWNWKHTDEGDRNPWAHVRSALTGPSVTIPLEDGKLDGCHSLPDVDDECHPFVAASQIQVEPAGGSEQSKQAEQAA